MSNQSRELLAVTARTGELPAMPEIVTDVLAITDDPASSMAEVSETLKRDPVLAAKILSVSNSSYYGMKQKVASLKLALVILGVREVRNIVLAVSMFECLRDDTTEKFMGKPFRQHCVEVAGLAKKLAERLDMNYHGEDFIAGLLHDIGKVVLWRQLRNDYEPLLKEADGSADKLYKKEREALGFTHADASAAIAETWNLPKTLVDALSYHHDDPEKRIENAKDPKLAVLVRIANCAVRDQEEENALEDVVQDDGIWRIIDPMENYDDPEARRDLLESFLGEIKEAPVPTF